MSKKVDLFDLQLVEDGATPGWLSVPIEDFPLEYLPDNDQIRCKPPTAELVEDIRANGLMEPVHLARTKNGKKIVIVSGRRRIKAFRELGHKTIPAKVMLDMGEIALARATIADNSLRSPNWQSDLEMVERLQDAGYTPKQIWRATGLNQSRVALYIRCITQLPGKLYSALKDGKITLSTANTVLKLTAAQKSRAADAYTATGKLTAENVKALKHVDAEKAWAEIPLFEEANDSAIAVSRKVLEQWQAKLAGYDSEIAGQISELLGVKMEPA